MGRSFRDVLGIAAALATVFGLASTDAYYAWFGFLYYTIGIPPEHILYRGATSFFVDPFAAGIYVAAMVLAIVAVWRDRPVEGEPPKHRPLTLTAFYLAVAAITAAAWFAGQFAGARAAALDAGVQTSRLALITELRTKTAFQGVTGANDGARLLLQTREGVYVVRQVENPNAQTPLVSFVPSNAIEGLTLCNGC